MKRIEFKIRFCCMILISGIFIYLLNSSMVQNQVAATVAAQEQIQEPSQENIQESSPALIQNASPVVEQPNRRSTENPEDLQFIWSFLEERKEIYLQEKPKWDTGITMEMVMASDTVIDTLIKQWLALAEFYPPKHFDGKSADDYIHEFIQYRFRYHYSLYEMDGPGSGGTIVKVLAGNNVISNLEDMIDETVSALVGYNDQFDYPAWKTQWEESY